MSEDMMQVIKYISQREEELSNYSDKLRQSIIRIFNTFGDPKECQICNWWDSYRSHFPYLKFAEHNFDEYGITEEEKNELLQSGKYFLADQPYALEGAKFNEKGQIRIFPNIHWHKFVPKIRLSINVDGDVFMSETDDGGNKIEYRVVSRKGALFISEVENEYIGYETLIEPKSASRRILKEIVKSRAVSKFLEKYREHLDKTTSEYDEVSTIAERIASMLMPAC